MTNINLTLLTTPSLDTLTSAELVAIHNKLASLPFIKNHPELTVWKKSKTLLIEKIEGIKIEVREKLARDEEMAARLNAVADSKTAENAKGKTENLTIGSVVSQLVLNPLLSYDQIVDMIRSKFPEANTSRRSVASVAARMRKDGIRVPFRRRKGINEI